MRIRTALLYVTIALPLLASAQEGTEEKFPWEDDSPTPAASGSPTPSAAPSPSPSPSPTPKPALTKEDVIAMSKAKIGDAVIIKKIQNSGVVFHLEVDDLVALKKSGVSGKVIEAMVATENEAPEETPEPTPTPKPTPDERLDDLNDPTPEPTATGTEEPDPFKMSGTPTPAPTPTVNPVWLPDATPTPEPTPWGRTGGVKRGTWDQGFAAGVLEAEEIPTTDWAAIGFGGGFCFGMIGCGAATAAGQVVDFPERRPAKLDQNLATPDYASGYQQGYKTKLKNRRSTSAFLGGAAGQVTFFLAYVAVIAVVIANATPEDDEQQAITAIRF